ncbi:MAG: YbaB/EbfC family nucleoid-associated protein [Gemmatimonadales bacterium]
MADLSQFLQLGQQMQGRLQQLQADLAGRSVEAAAGGGLVRVKTDGRGLVRELVIDPEAFEGRDPELLADLILSAIAEAQRRAGEAAQAEARKVPGMPFPLGL